MIWQTFLWRFRLESPLHVGLRPTANLQRTRQYVPARNVWAAATARVAQWFGSADYGEVGEDVSAHLRFSYLYPQLGDLLVLPPGKPELERLFLDSISSTALDPHSTAAEAGSLHEIEVVLPRTRESPSRHITLTGLLWARAGIGRAVEFDASERGLPVLCSKAGEVVPATELFAWLQVGGERRYGLGRIRLLEFVPVKDSGANPFDGGWDGGELDGPRMSLPVGGCIWAHAIVGDAAVEGDLEALVGRDWSVEGAGRRLTRGNLCWTPGSVCQSPQSFRVSSGGIWREIDGDKIDRAPAR